MGALILLLLLSLPGSALSESLSGICPDGSLFVVSRSSDIPCARAKVVDDASQLPPVRPELLPYPYTWYVDQEARNPNNPYNLHDAAQRIREGQAQLAEKPAMLPPPELTLTQPAPQRAATFAPKRGLGLNKTELRDLIQLLSLRQGIAPASFTIEDVHRNTELVIQLAHSESFASRVSDALGLSGESVLVFSARSIEKTRFHPNFFLVQNGATYRPNIEDTRQMGLLLGEVGELRAGQIVVGYLVAPGRFDPRSDLEVWWNDRSVRTTLRPE